MVAKEKKAEFFLFMQESYNNDQKQIKIASFASDSKKLLKEKLRTSEGKSPAQKMFIARTYPSPISLSFTPLLHLIL